MRLTIAVEILPADPRRHLRTGLIVARNILLTTRLRKCKIRRCHAALPWQECKNFVRRTAWKSEFDSPQHPDKLFHVGRKRRLEMHGLTACRVLELQQIGMQRLAVEMVDDGLCRLVFPQTLEDAVPHLSVRRELRKVDFRDQAGLDVAGGSRDGTRQVREGRRLLRNALEAGGEVFQRRIVEGLTSGANK